MASPCRSCPCFRRPSRCTVSRLSGDGGDDTTADDAECIGDGGCGGGPPALGPHRPSPPPAWAPRTLSPSVVAAWRRPPTTGWTLAQACGTSFCSTWHPVPSLAVTSLLYPPPARGVPCCAMVRAPWVCCALGLRCTIFWVHNVVHASAYCCPVQVCHSPSGHVLDSLVLVLVLRVLLQLVGVRPPGPLGCYFVLPCVSRPRLLSWPPLRSPGNQSAVPPSSAYPWAACGCPLTWGLVSLPALPCDARGMCRLFLPFVLPPRTGCSFPGASSRSPRLFSGAGYTTTASPVFLTVPHLTAACTPPAPPPTPLFTRHLIRLHSSHSARFRVYQCFRHSPAASLSRTPSQAGPGRRPPSPRALVPRAQVTGLAAYPGCSSPEGHLCVSAFRLSRPRSVARHTPIADIPLRALAEPLTSLTAALGDLPAAASPLGDTLPPLRLSFPPLLISAGLSSACLPSGAPSARRPPGPPHLTRPPADVAASVAVAVLPSS